MTEIKNLPNRVIAYIDGFNLYFGMREGSFRRYLWLDLPTLCSRLLKPWQELVGTKYFTARMSGPPDRVKRQGTYIEALQTLANLSVIEGQYIDSTKRCGNCGHQIHSHTEKMTDVNIAVEITKDAHAGRFDTAMLITGDSDQTPTVKMIRELFPQKRVVCIFPPCRISKQLRIAAHGYLHINENHLRDSQFPRVIIKPSGFRLSKPVEWF